VIGMRIGGELADFEQPVGPGVDRHDQERECEQGSGPGRGAEEGAQRRSQRLARRGECGQASLGPQLFEQPPRSRQRHAGHREQRKRPDHTRQCEQHPTQNPAPRAQCRGPERETRQPVVTQGGASPVGSKHDEVVGPEHDHAYPHRAPAEAARDHGKAQQQQERVEARAQLEPVVVGRHGVEQQVRDRDPDRRGVAAHVEHRLEIHVSSQEAAEVLGVALVLLPASGREAALDCLDAGGLVGHATDLQIREVAHWQRPKFAPRDAPVVLQVSRDVGSVRLAIAELGEVLGGRVVLPQIEHVDVARAPGLFVPELRLAQVVERQERQHPAARQHRHARPAVRGPRGRGQKFAQHRQRGDARHHAPHQ
jgi:hypothetical protein